MVYNRTILITYSEVLFTITARLWSICHGIKISLRRMTLVHPYLVARATGPSYSP